MKTLFRFPSQLLGLAVCLMMIPFGASAQQVQVRGTVTGADDGEPIMGGSVMVKGTTIGVATGLDGTYSISVDRNATLVFNSVGYVTEEVAVNGRSTIDVVLAVDRELLDDVLVVGYALRSRRARDRGTDEPGLDFDAYRRPYGQGSGPRHHAGRR